MTKYYTNPFTSRVPLQWCPGCFRELDAITNCTGGDMPEPGDFTVCIECAQLLRFGDDMVLRTSSLAEIPELERTEFAKLIITIQVLGPGPKKVPRTSIM